jgi:predicted nucleic acid-binding protein
VLVAVDTNVLLDHAEEDACIPQCIKALRERLKIDIFLVPPTVLQELAHLYDRGDTARKRDLAFKVLSEIFKWGYQPVNLIPVGNGVVEQIGLKLRLLGIFPDQEVNDSLIVAEAALLGCGILLSSDGHMKDANDHPSFRGCLADFHVEGSDLALVSPRAIVEKYGVRP